MDQSKHKSGRYESKSIFQVFWSHTIVLWDRFFTHYSLKWFITTDHWVRHSNRLNHSGFKNKRSDSKEWFATSLMNFHELQWMSRKFSEYFLLQKESNVGLKQQECGKMTEQCQMDFKYIFKTGNYQKYKKAKLTQTAQLSIWWFY